MVLNDVGQRVKKIRNEQVLSQEKLALKADIDRTLLKYSTSGRGTDGCSHKADVAGTGG